MDSEAQQQTRESRRAGRAVLSRIEQPLTAAALQEECKRALAAGFDGIELPLDAGGVPGPNADMFARSRSSEPAGASGIREEGLSEKLATPDLKIGAVSARCTATKIEAAVAEVKELLRQTAECGGRCLNLTIPPIRAAPAHGGTGWRREGGGKETEAGSSEATLIPTPHELDARCRGFTSYQEALNLAYGLLNRIRLDAESSGVAVALEAGANGCLLSPVELREIIDAAPSWAVGACIDAVRVARLGSPTDWIRILGARIHAVRLGHPLQSGAAEVVDPSPATTSDESGSARAVCDVLDEVHYQRLLIASGGTLPERAAGLNPRDITNRRDRWLFS